MRHKNCLVWAVAGLCLGVAYNAWAEPPNPETVQLDTVSQIMNGSGQIGLPAVLAVIGWLLGRGGITVKLSESDRELMRSCIKTRENRDD